MPPRGDITYTYGWTTRTAHYTTENQIFRYVLRATPDGSAELEYPDNSVHSDVSVDDFDSVFDG